MSLQEVVSIRIREAREEKGWSQVELARMLNVTNSAISLWENGHQFPGPKRIEALARLTGRPASWFLTPKEARPFRLCLLTLTGEEATPEAVQQVRELVRVAGLGTLSECYRGAPNLLHGLRSRARAAASSRPAA